MVGCPRRSLDQVAGAPGLLCFSDQIAIGATRVARILGRGIPEDLSVVGFDDLP